MAGINLIHEPPLLRTSPRNHNPPIVPPFSRKRPAVELCKLPSTKRLRPDIQLATPHDLVIAPKQSPTKRPRLTRGNLEILNQMGKQGSRATKSLKSETTKSISTTNPRFEEQASINGILVEALSVAPTNMALLKDVLDRRRDTASPTESSYERYTHHMSRADNEEAVAQTFPRRVMLSFDDDSHYSTGWNHAFSSFPADVGFNDNLSPAQPDFVQGVEAPQFLRQIHEQLGGAIKPYAACFAPTLSHLAGEWKGPGKNLQQAQRQAAYDGACLVFGRNTALEFLGTLDDPGHAYIQTFATDGHTLHTFAHHAQRTNDRVEYHQSTTSRTLLDNTYDEFRLGCRRTRNMQDFARDNSRNLKDQLNEYEPPEPLSDTGSTGQLVVSHASTELSTVSPRHARQYENEVQSSEIDELSLELEVPANVNPRTSSKIRKRKGKRNATVHKTKKRMHP